MSYRTHAIVARFSALLIAILVPLTVLQAQDYDPNPYTFTTFAGVSPNDSRRNANGIGSAARFEGPNYTAVDSLGNVYVTSSYTYAIRKITPAGVVTTFAGNFNTPGWADGTGAGAFFNSPSGIAVDGANNVYVADTGNHTIRKITPAGVVTTLAGLAGSFGSTDATGSAARFRGPTGLAVDGAGNVYVADSGNFTIRKITPAGLVTTLAGSVGNFGYSNGTGSEALFSGEASLAVDAAGNLYVVEAYDSTVRQITPAGVVTTFAGAMGTAGSADGTGSDARFIWPKGIALDSSGNLYVGDTGNHTIRMITPGAVVTTLAGTAGTMSSADGTGGVAGFSSPKGVAVDSSGSIYVADSVNNTIRKLTPTGVVTTFAGASGGPGSSDGAISRAQFNIPYGVAVDASNNLYVADMNNHTIRKITAAGEVTTLAGTAGVVGYIDGAGSAAQFNAPRGVAVDATGNVYISDLVAHTIRKITSAGVVTTLAGLAGGPGSTDGIGTAAQFKNPAGLAADGLGNIYVADSENHTIRKITAAGAVTTFAGTPGIAGSADGTGSAAQFSYPNGVAADSAGNLYVADSGNKAVRKITTAGVVTTMATVTPRLYQPSSVAVDGSGNVFTTAFYSHIILKITPAGVVTIIGGSSGNPGWTDGTGSAAWFNSPGAIAVDSVGKIYVADTYSHTIRQGRAPSAPIIMVQPLSQNIAGSYPVTFSVTADGIPTPTYQWQKNGVNISGATGSSYTIASVVENDTGSYTVLATNSMGSVASNVAGLTTFIAVPSNALITITVE